MSSPTAKGKVRSSDNPLRYRFISLAVRAVQWFETLRCATDYAALESPFPEHSTTSQKPSAIRDKTRYWPTVSGSSRRSATSFRSRGVNILLRVRDWSRGPIDYPNRGRPREGKGLIGGRSRSSRTRGLARSARWTRSTFRLAFDLGGGEIRKLLLPASSSTEKTIFSLAMLRRSPLQLWRISKRRAAHEISFLGGLNIHSRWEIFINPLTAADFETQSYYATGIRPRRRNLSLGVHFWKSVLK